MRVFGRIAAIICLICMFFCLTGCVNDANDSENFNSVVKNVRYKGTELSLPEDNFILSQVSANENKIYVYGYPYNEESTKLKVHIYDLTGEYNGCFEIPKFSEKYQNTIMNLYADNYGNLWLLKYLNEYEYVNGNREISDDISSWVAEAYNESGELLFQTELMDIVIIP